MDMITAEEVIRRIEMYYEGGALTRRREAANRSGEPASALAAMPAPVPTPEVGAATPIAIA